jgi:hypothetical protein
VVLAGLRMVFSSALFIFGADAENDLVQARKIRELLDQRQREGDREVEYAGYRVTEAVGEALKTDPAVAALIGEYKATQERLICLRECIRRVGSALGIGHADRFWEAERSDYRASDFPEVGVWTAAIAALKADANVVLPVVAKLAGSSGLSSTRQMRRCQHEFGSR